MPWQGVVKAGITNVIVGGNGPYSAGDVVTLTDAAYAATDPAVFPLVFAGAPSNVQGQDQIYPLKDGYGLLTATGDPAAFTTNGTGVGSNLWLTRTWVPAGVAITNLWIGVSAAGTWDTTSTPNHLGLFTDAGVKVDTTADLGALYGTTGWRGGALSGGVVAAQSLGRFVYLGFCTRGQGAGLGIQFVSASNGFPAMHTNVSGTTKRRAMYAASSSAGFPASIDPTSYGTSTGYVPLMGIS